MIEVAEISNMVFTQTKLYGAEPEGVLHVYVGLMRKRLLRDDSAGSFDAAFTSRVCLSRGFSELSMSICNNGNSRPN